ncbi:PREDICTED: H/ACA ribonucleoprotein complex non-core subunit NAF1 isoform X2 [Nanorana parkeri]|uniref:H/ACA ribonucleoprotein complex non-core subunit NAF1 isoform X2 n=1 Tax=Nanorana parkeri TaxID=125878 RepID=UPI00085438E9|nr:PREDICTED: H/ACA ribonucleoprotein complex non-core subunit NAF1 isoform X2 [Nanorana parkeri]
MDTQEESVVAEVAVNTQQNNVNSFDCKSEEASVADVDPGKEGSLSGCSDDATEAPMNNNDGTQTSSSAAGIPRIEEKPGSCQPCEVQPEEQMELGETLHFENHTVAMHNGNPGESPHVSVCIPQASGKILSVSHDELEESSSGDSSSDSESDSSSSTSSSSSSTSLFIMLRADEEEPLENSEAPLKTKDELLLEELPAVEELAINLPDDVEIKPFGKVSSIIDQLVIVESLHDIPPLNEDTVVFNGNRLAVGKIFEIFGPVPHPFYVLRFNSKDHVERTGVEIKDTLYFAPAVKDFTQYIIPDALKREKGSDASWTNDQEPPAEALDYSDDEKEKEAKQKKKSQNAGKKKQKAENEKSSSSQESNQFYRGQKFSRPYSRNVSAPRFSNGRGSHMQENTFRQRQEPYFPPHYQGQHMMHQPYAYHSTSPPDYSVTYANNGHQPPQPPFYEHYQNMQHFPASPFPPPHMIWPEQNMHFPYMQNYCLPPPPPPPPPPPAPYPIQGDPNCSNRNHS